MIRSRHYNLTLKQWDEIHEMLNSERQSSAQVLGNPKMYPNGFNLVADYILHCATTKYPGLDPETIRNLESRIADLLERPRPAGSAPRILAHR